MTAGSIGGGFERYRLGYLKLRSVLHDRATALPAYPLLVDRLRGWLEDRRHVGVVHVSCPELDTVESLYGWQVFDRIAARSASALRGALRGMPSGTLLAVDRVSGGQFLLFVRQTAEGDDVDGQCLDAIGEAAAVALEAAFTGDEFDGMSPRLSFRWGHALLSMDTFFRFERRVYAAVDEARTRHDRRDRRHERSQDDELRRIIDGGGVRAVFQPVVDLETGDALGMEAFARGPADSRLEMPDALFAVSGRLGISPDLDRLCRTTALRESAGVHGGGELFLNVWPGNLHDPEWENGVQQTLPEEWRERWNVVIEVSERAAGGDLDRLARALERLKSLGFAVALDDVGTGYGSLALLERVRPNYLKVDRSLVRGIDSNLIKQEVLASLAQLANRIDALLVAEGIESEAEARAVRAAGARFGQGYLFAAPSPARGVRLRGRRQRGSRPDRTT